MINIKEFAFEVKNGSFTNITIPLILTEEVLSRADEFLSEVDRVIEVSQGVPFEKEPELQIKNGWNDSRKCFRDFITGSKNIEVNFGVMFTNDEDRESQEFETCETRSDALLRLGVIKLEGNVEVFKRMNPLKLKPESFDSDLLGGIEKISEGDRFYCVANVTWKLTFDSYIMDYSKDLGVTEVYLISNSNKS